MFINLFYHFHCYIYMSENYIGKLKNKVE